MKYTVTLGLMVMLATLSASASPGDDERRGYRSKFYGVVEQMPADAGGTWTVSGRAVVISPATEIEEEYGRLAPGAFVEVEGRSDGETFWAHEIEVKRGQEGRDGQRAGDWPGAGLREEFHGVVRSIPQGRLGTWLIDEREVFVDERTRIDEDDGPIRVGVVVEVKGRRRDETFHAREIEFEARSP